MTLNLVSAAILGAVEGITEFLPISSTGHLILAGKVLGIAQTDFVKTFEIAIQLGAILAVIGIFWRKFFAKTTFLRVVTAFIPTAIIGFALYKVIKDFLLGNTTVVAWSLLLGGLFLLAFERRKHTPNEPQTVLPTTKQALLIGLVQSLAVIPGVSRSAATIVAGLGLGMSRKSIVEFSFLLAVPTMVAATGLDVIKSASQFHASDTGVLAIGFLVAGITAFFAVRWLLRYVSTKTFTPFAYYRIVVGVLVLLLLR